VHTIRKLLHPPTHAHPSTNAPARTLLHRQTRRILQIDFTEESIFVIAKGQRARTIAFETLQDVDADDDLPRFMLSVKVSAPSP
jgi:hypothetical protein